MTLQAPNRRVSGLQTREWASPHYHGLGGRSRVFLSLPGAVMITLTWRKLTLVTRKTDCQECQTEGRGTRCEVSAIVAVKNGKKKACIRE